MANGWGNVKGETIQVRFRDEVLEVLEKKAEAEHLSVGLWIKKRILELCELCNSGCSEGSSQS